MLTVMIFVFLIGYLCIALEHPLKVNKAGTALLTGTILWVLYTFAAPDLIPTASAEEFKEFLDAYPAIADLPFVEQCTRFVVEHQVLDRNCRNIDFFDWRDDYRGVDRRSRRFHVYHKPYQNQPEKKIITTGRIYYFFHVCHTR